MAIWKINKQINKQTNNLNETTFNGIYFTAQCAGVTGNITFVIGDNRENRNTIDNGICQTTTNGFLWVTRCKSARVLCGEV